jgi:hypothetical protein
LSHFIISDKVRAANTSVFVAGWRSHLQHFAGYDALSGTVARELGLSAVIAGLSAESLAETMTFEEVERRIIQDPQGPHHRWCRRRHGYPARTDCPAP